MASYGKNCLWIELIECSFVFSRKTKKCINVVRSKKPMQLKRSCEFHIWLCYWSNVCLSLIFFRSKGVASNKKMASYGKNCLWIELIECSFVFSRKTKKCINVVRSKKPMQLKRSCEFHIWLCYWSNICLFLFVFCI